RRETLKDPSRLMVRRRAPLYCCVRPGSKEGVMFLRVSAGFVDASRRTLISWRGPNRGWGGSRRPRELVSASRTPFDHRERLRVRQTATAPPAHPGSYIRRAQRGAVRTSRNLRAPDQKQENALAGRSLTRRIALGLPFAL